MEEVARLTYHLLPTPRVLQWVGARNVAERDGVDEGGEAAWGGVVTGVVVGQQRRHLAHRLRQLRELLDGVHRRRCTRVPHPLPALDLDGSGAPAAAAMLPTH